MIDQSRTRWDIARDLPVAAGVESLNEGSALVQVIQNGEVKVKNSAGTTGEIFVGVAYSQMDAPDTAVDVREYTIPASPYTIVLPNVPVSGQILVKQGSTVYTVATSSPSATANAQLAAGSNNLIFHSSDAGKTVVVTYKYVPSINQARRIAGDGIPGLGNPVHASGTVGVIQHGSVFTDQFDVSADWGAANVADIKTGAGGLFVRGGNGALVSGYVLAVPVVDSPYLGLYVRA